MAQQVDLRKLIMMIDEKKELNAQLALEFDCNIEVEDMGGLVKLLNYMINYVNQLSDQKLNISLNDQMEEYLVNFSINTDKMELPPFNEQVADSLKAYDAKYEIKQEPGKWVMLLVSFY